MQNWREFKQKREGYEPPRGKPIPSQPGPVYTFYPHPTKPGILWEPAEEPLMDGGEMTQAIRLYQYNPQKNELRLTGSDVLWLDDFEMSDLQPITLNNPIRVY